MEAFIGTVLPWAGNWEPQGWAYCDGRQIAIQTNQALFAVLGTTYGGDGKTYFNLPDLRGRVPLCAGQLQPTGGRYIAGQKGGAENVNVTNQLPAHTHTFAASATVNVGTPFNTTSTGTPAGGTLTGPTTSTCLGAVATSAGVKPNIYTTAPPNTMMATMPTTATVSGSTGSTGTGTAGSTQSIDNRQPYLSLNFIICLVGIWPDRG